MSLLLDALRRAAATKQGTASDQYTVPRRSGMAREIEESSDFESASDDGELTLEPEMPRETATPRSADADPQPELARRTAAGTLAGPRRGGGRRTGGAARMLLGGTAVLGALAAIGAGGWWYYLESQQASRDDLSAWEPTAEPLVDDEPLAASGEPAEVETQVLADDEAFGEPAVDAEEAVEAGTNGQDAAEETVARVDTDALESMDGETGGDTASAAAGGGEESAAASGSGGNGGGSAADGNGGAGETRAASATRTDKGTQETASTSTQSQSGEPVIRSSKGPSELMQALQAGYAALRAGDLEAAGHAYARARELAPDNRDALFGAASVAQRRGDETRAAEYYRKVLRDHPRDEYARAALAGLEGGREPRRSETELKGMLRDQPDSASLHFALGNVYAAESRWSEAQKAYFEAHRLESDNADYAYNLAVALDHLGQRDAARSHYRRAIEVSGEGGSDVPVAAVRRRLEQLE